MKKTLLLLGLILAVSCQNDEELKSNFQNETLDTRVEMNKFIQNQMVETSTIFDWDKQEDQVIWEALKLSDHKLLIGVDADNIDAFLAEYYDLMAVNKQDLRSLSENDLLKLDATLNYLTIKVNNFESFKALRNSSLSLWVEPAYSYMTEQEMKTINLITPERKYTQAGNTKNKSLNYTYRDVLDSHGVPSAWDKEITGKNTTVAVVDNGLIRGTQYLDDGNFTASGNSYANKTITKAGVYNTYYFMEWWTGDTNDGVYALSGDMIETHGTTRAQEISNPMNNDGNPVGIAYDSNLYTLRASWFPVLTTPAQFEAVTEAYKHLAVKRDVKVISMSMGTVIHSHSIENAINYAQSKGKLMFAAGGTSHWSVSWMVDTTFPATLDNVIACTGIKKIDAAHSDYEKCNHCHDGEEIEFATEFSEDRDDWTSFNGSSSEATASNAAIAALIWSKYPSLTAAQVKAKMVAASEFKNNKNNTFGYGKVYVDRLF